MTDDSDSKSQTQIDRSSPLPLWYQLRQALLVGMQSGDFAPGEPLPSEKRLEEMYDLSRITVRRALSELAAEGYIAREVGRGSFVLQSKIQHSSGRIGGLHDDLAAQGRRVESKILDHEWRPAPASVAQRLHVDEGHPLLYIRKLVFADGEPILLGAYYHNLGTGVHFTEAELASDSIYTLLEQKYGIALRRAERTIEVAVALERDATLLGVQPNAPMLLVRLIVYDLQGKPVSYARALYRGDRYKYVHTVTR